MNDVLKYLREQAKNYDCSVCGTNHGRSRISVLGKKDGGWVVRVVCAKCDTGITLLVFVSDRDPAPTPRLAARQRRQTLPPVSLDEVLDAHDLLESYTGDALTLFAPRGKVRTSTDAT